MQILCFHEAVYQNLNILLDSDLHNLMLIQLGMSGSDIVKLQIMLEDIKD